MHPYERSPHSGAGNCHCGMAEHSRAHPHAYAQAYKSELCVCACPAGHGIHTDAATAAPEQVRAGLDGVREAIRLARGTDAVPLVPGRFD
jgi:hypothetical protein